MLVDVGCGTGGNAAALADAYRVIGVDPEPQAITLATQRFPSIEFREGFAPPAVVDALPNADIVLLADVLEHAEDDCLLISELLASMRPGAHLLLMAPADPDLWSCHDWAFQHYRRYTLTRLRQAWATLPVTERIVTYCNARLYPVVQIMRTLSRLRGKSLGESDSDLSLPSAPVNALLKGIFQSEGRAILRSLDTSRPAFCRGVSVLALLRREEGIIQPRPRPADLAPDPRPWMQLSETGKTSS